MLPRVGIEEKYRFDGCLCFYGYPECTVVKTTERFMRFIESAFRENENGNAFPDGGLEHAHTFGAVHGAGPVYCYGRIPVDESKHRHLAHFNLSENADGLADSFDDNGYIQIRDMVGDKNILLFFMMRVFIQITMSDTNKQKPGICPEGTEPVNKIASFYLPEEGCDDHDGENQQHQCNENDRGIEKIEAFDG